MLFIVYQQISVQTVDCVCFNFDLFNNDSVEKFGEITVS